VDPRVHPALLNHRKVRRVNCVSERGNDKRKGGRVLLAEHCLSEKRRQWSNKYAFSSIFYPRQQSDFSNSNSPLARKDERSPCA